MVVIRINPYKQLYLVKKEYIALWCSGSIQDSGSWDPSSNLGGAEDNVFSFIFTR